MALQLQLWHYYSKPTSIVPPNFPNLTCISNTLIIPLASTATTNSTKMPTFSFRNKNDAPFLYKSHNNCARNRLNIKIRASSETTPASSRKNSNSIIVWSLLSVVLAVANRVLYKLALVPLKEFPFFLAQFITFGYVAIYFAILFIRRRAGIATDEMLAIPKSRFFFIGFLEALGLAAGMSSAAMIPGPAIPVLQQSFLVWLLSFSTIFLGRRYSFLQIVGCLLVAAGVVIAVSSGSVGGQVLSGVPLIWPALMIASGACHAGATILKEFVFVDAAARLKDKSLDVFVVNSFGSGFQALFVLFLLPLLSNMKGIPFSELPSYLKSGAACFLNFGVDNPGCDGAPLLPLLYVCSNIAFNISILNLLKIAGAVVSSLVAMVSVPISIYILSLPLPYLPESVSLSLFFVIGSVVLMSGLILYNLPQASQRRS